MKLILRITFLLFLVVNYGCAQQKLENSTLWKISGNGLEKPSYLFGTIHVYCGEVPFDKEDLEAMDKTEQLALEVDMSNPAAMQQEVFKYSFLPTGKSITESLTAQEVKKLDSLFTKKIGVPFATFQTMKPILTSSFLITKMIDCKSIMSYEDAILQKFKKQNKKISGLETISDQMKALDAMPFELQVQGLKDLVNEPDKMKSYLEKMITVYDQENIEELLLVMNEDESFDEVSSKALLDTRNKNWIPVMKEKMKKAPTFFAVGAGHLAGENGLINLLRKAGYTVKAE
ncbi:TraB/GumN family protein [Aureivirga marina]|uniref:TraB/GumN family protein n=1 Tax=Aureivirga marina TaxID=1182451 RepID=UPI0018CB08D2|nr:TraB/GumN family protein [Aureivirga marina]